MKSLITSAVLFLFGITTLQAQNYRGLNSSSEYFFTSTAILWPTYLQNQVYGLKCDSIQGTISDSTFFPYRTIKAVLPADSSCSVDPNYPIWAGRKIVVDSNNKHFFETFSGDSLLLTTQTYPGDTQTIYSYLNGDRIIAIHTSNTQMTFANITDSVKNYSLQMLDPSNNVVSGYWNGKIIIVSKNNGVVQLPGIVNFPTDTMMFTRVFAKRLTYNDVFPWQVGDQLHEGNYVFSQMSFHYDNYVMNKFILARTMINPDSVDFTIRVVTNHTSNGPPINITTIDTITYSVGNLSSFIETVMPQQTIDSLLSYDLFMYPSDCGRLRMVDHVINEFYIENTVPCVQENNFEPHDYDNIYIEGVAGYYHYDYPYAGNNVTSGDFHNIYYSIGATSCGTPTYVGIDETTIPSFQLFPNPASGVVNLVLPMGKQEVAISDIAGRICKREEFSNGGNCELNISGLQTGMYFVTVTNELGTSTQRLEVK